LVDKKIIGLLQKLSHKTLLLVLLFAPQFLQAQVSGTVVDAISLDPLFGANIELAKAQSGTTTDIDGYFFLSNASENGNDTLIITYLGYLEERIALRIFSDRGVIRMRPSPITVDEGVEVIGERIDASKRDLPGIVESLNRKQIENYAVGDMKALINKLPAIRMVGNDVDGAYLEIRGSNANEVNVYIDGISINGVDFNNQADVNLISPESIENIKIQKGGNFLLRGQGASGGVVHIDTKIPTVYGAQILSKVGDFETRRLTAIIDLPLTEKLAFTYNGTYSHNRPELIYEINRFDPSFNQTYKLTNEKYVHNLNGYFLLPTGRLGAKVIYFAGENKKEDWQKQRNVALIAGTFVGDFAGVEGMQLNISQNYTDEIIDRQIPDRDDLAFRYQYDSEVTQLHFQKVFQAQLMRFTTAYDFFHDQLQQTSTTLTPGEASDFYKALTYDNQHSISGVLAFTDTSAQIRNLNTSIFASFRQNWWVSGQSDFVTNIGVQIRQLDDNSRWQAHGNYGKNVRYPTLLENAYVGDVVYFGAGEESGLEKLRPEYIESAEVGGRIVQLRPYPYIRRFSIEGAFFWRKVENKVITQPIDNLQVLVQDGSNNSTGGDFALRVNPFATYLETGISLAWLATGNKLLYPYKPENSLKLWLDYSPNAGVYSNLLMFHDGISYAWYYDANNNLVTRQIDAYWDTDIVVGYKNKFGALAYNLQIAIRNALDNSEYVDYYLKKRFIQFSLSLRY
jgi:outer membrane receptor protein involved in Fe transport